MVVARRLAHGRRRAQHLGRRAFAPHRTILVPLLGHEESEHAVVLACRLAADRNARVVLLAPLAVEPELPLDAHFDDEERSLKDWLGRVRAYAESYGISPKTRMIRTRNFGLDVAEEARTEQASLIVVGAPIRSRQGFTGAFPEEGDRILRHAPCRVMIATGEFVGSNGRPTASGEMEETLLPKWIALPIFASDPLSSVAYATEAALFVLIAASLASRGLVLPIAGGIAVFLGIVVLSYRQTVRAYETSGGAYVVAKNNLGTLPSLVAGAALLVDYVLTVAVSIAAGVFAITSVSSSLADHKLGISLAFVLLITLANLRGVREAGLLFALPTYGFIVSLYAAIGVGLWKVLFGTTPHAVVPPPVAVGTGTIGVFVILRAFASGSSALTGVEAIANGVNAFRHPHSKNAARTLTIMGTIAITLFLGVSYLTVKIDARPSQTASVLSQIARGSFPDGSSGGWMYYVVQAFTFAVLVLAANTSYQGFPRLAALLARDGFIPRQFTNLGDRLVFSNGIIVLAGAAAVLLWIYAASVDSLIHLYVIGVFTAFTLSQAGMVRYWRRQRGPGWRYRASVNGVGATATGVVAAVVIVTKFAAGAWIVIVAIPFLVLISYRIRRHYRGIERRLRAGAAAVVAAPPPTNTTLLLVESIDEATGDALWFTRT